MFASGLQFYSKQDSDIVFTWILPRYLTKFFRIPYLLRTTGLLLRHTSGWRKKFSHGTRKKMFWACNAYPIKIFTIPYLQDTPVQLLLNNSRKTRKFCFGKPNKKNGTRMTAHLKRKKRKPLLSPKNRMLQISVIITTKWTT